MAISFGVGMAMRRPGADAGIQFRMGQQQQNHHQQQQLGKYFRQSGCQPSGTAARCRIYDWQQIARTISL
jgi:hypothetical protein